MAEQKKLRVTLVRGLMGKKQDHRDTVRGLGLKWRSHTVEVEDTPSGALTAGPHRPTVRQVTPL